MSELILKKVKAYTIVSSDDEKSASEKGIYKNYDNADTNSYGCGWYETNGVVVEKENTYEDQNGEVYIVTHYGKYTDVEEIYNTNIVNSIKEKLSLEELNYLYKFWGK